MGNLDRLQDPKNKQTKEVSLIATILHLIARQRPRGMENRVRKVALREVEKVPCGEGREHSLKAKYPLVNKNTG